MILPDPFENFTEHPFRLRRNFRVSHLLQALSGKPEKKPSDSSSPSDDSEFDTAFLIVAMVRKSASLIHSVLQEKRDLTLRKRCGFLSLFSCDSCIFRIEKTRLACAVRIDPVIPASLPVNDGSLRIPPAALQIVKNSVRRLKISLLPGSFKEPEHHRTGKGIIRISDRHAAVKPKVQIVLCLRKMICFHKSEKQKSRRPEQKVR